MKTSSRRGSADFLDKQNSRQPPHTKEFGLDNAYLQAGHGNRPKRVQKSPKAVNNIPSYRSVIYHPGKESFSMADCDTSAIDAVLNLKDLGGTPSYQSSTHSKTSHRVDLVIPEKKIAPKGQVESIREVQPFEPHNKNAHT
jgi:hypothetical protein